MIPLKERGHSTFKTFAVLFSGDIYSRKPESANSWVAIYNQQCTMWQLASPALVSILRQRSAVAIP